MLCISHGDAGLSHSADGNALPFRAMTDTVAGDRIDSILDKTEFHSFFDETVGPAVKISERDGEFASGIKGLDRLLATDA